MRRRRGKKPRSGLNYRIAPDEETAIEAALRTATSRPGEPIFYPYQGTTFNSRDEAWHFYNLYSWEMGFGIRITDSRTNTKGYMTKADLVCSCAGLDKNPESASARTNCKAMIRLLRRGDDSWYIKTVDDTHNHRLTSAFGENQQWPSHGKLDTATQELVRRLKENNISLGRICNILGVADSQGISAVRKESVRSLCAKISRENLRDDMAKTKQLLDSMKAKDPGFEVKFQINNKGMLTGMLWCTSKNRLDYSNFGDAITFDTTYRTNLYSLPFGIFVGVNNHFQSTIFGGVLLTSEKTEDFEWAFGSFLNIMGGKAPTTMLTDQCAAMAKAMKSTMPNTNHRWCRWHVLKDAKSHLGDPYSKNSKFKEEFNNLVTFETNPKLFELRLKSLQEKYNLKDNNYLNRLYKHRAKWAKPYFMGIFCAGMTSTQRSESANHMIKSLIQKAAPMHLFVSKFRDLQTSRNRQESTQDFITHQRRRRLRSKFPLEEHGNEVYSRAAYEMFSDQLHRSASYIIKSQPNDSTYVLVHSRFEDSPDAIYMTVRLQGTDTVTCTCGLYEHLGILCRHAIKVLYTLDRRQIPRANILKRWTKVYDNNHSTQQFIEHLSEANDDMKRTMLINTALQLANSTGKISNTLYADTMASIMKAVDTASSSATPCTTSKQVDENTLPTSWPSSTYKGGRPAHSSLKSWQSSIKRQRVQSSDEAQKQAADWPEEEEPTSQKKRSLYNLTRP
ncbi:unnamed protein product [Urochloa decumbens]|uniref:Protein FAR1-RELATED SEQUENCE n=1 Tax=Urochloa decumbens TaxID=240449 RepID=A0ABC9E6F8_9POAL